MNWEFVLVALGLTGILDVKNVEPIRSPKGERWGFRASVDGLLSGVEASCRPWKYECEILPIWACVYLFSSFYVKEMVPLALA